MVIGIACLAFRPLQERGTILSFGGCSGFLGYFEFYNHSARAYAPKQLFHFHEHWNNILPLEHGINLIQMGEKLFGTNL